MITHEGSNVRYGVIARPKLAITLLFLPVVKLLSRHLLVEGEVISVALLTRFAQTELLTPTTPPSTAKQNPVLWQTIFRPSRNNSM